ncbi:cation-translocating P-type ATPase [Vogesella sp. LYT5W]|uniref:Cation-translocating P-type ATPase n=1 Tax=Vogesella margarita TaxID=2984199 RepID=A0ABT5IQU4_9NEIS|nr:cation-translocating P-type ATPase [Vogesella margarita]MDC7714922.1 cation-translocating P-type ATPase [Vogesella margarita]
MSEAFPRGLSHSVARARLVAEGANELGTEQRRSLAAIAGEVVREPMFLLLLGAGAIYLAMGDAHEALILLGFVAIIMAVTIVQERRTENALEALRDLSSPRALVIRDGEAQRIAGREVVRDDILILSEGDRIAADGVVLQAHELATDESMLSGESEPVAKFGQREMAYAGTLVVRGQGLLQVCATGQRTELGRIGKSLSSIAVEASPLRDEITRLTRRLAVLGIGLCLLLALLYWLLRDSWLDALLAGITLAMGILPQEFPVIMIVFLALGARRIASHQVLTRRLNAIETLGQTTVLCVDKTGTLTQNRMALAALAVDGQLLDTGRLPGGELPEAYHELLEYAVLASEIEPHDPMEQAFHHYARTHLADTEHLHPAWSLAREYELSPALMAMSHLWRQDDGDDDVVAAKGAPEAIAELCHLPDAARARLIADATTLADRGLRVLGIAKARHSTQQAWPSLQHDFDFELLGLAGFADPLRPEVPAAIRECRQAGIRVLMITGDHPHTARAIASQAGIESRGTLTGADLAALGDDAANLGRQLAGVNVVARVTPQQKLAIVNALKAAGEVVAMTGDGVNDAPALKAAHIGIAMGKRGTDVAREAAALVLLDDDFTAIVAAIRLGRRIFANLRQAMSYTLAVHVPIIGLSMLPLLFGMPLILAPIHIAFLELVIDPACSIVFEAEPERPQQMQQPPRRTGEALLSLPQLVLALAQGALVLFSCGVAYAASLAAALDDATARALAFIVLVSANALLILPNRSAQSGWRALFGGLSAVAAWVLGGTLLSLLLITSIPALAGAFGFVPLAPGLWLAAFALGCATLLLLEGSKRIAAWRG